MSKFISGHRDEGVGIIEINRPKKKNALTVDMYSALLHHLESGEQDRDTRVHLLLGTTDSFTAGNDLHDFLHNPPREADSPVLRFLRGISSLQKPLVAGVAGVAVGIGSTLLLHCDVVIAGTSARFQMPFTRLGLCPEAGSSLLLPLSAGYRLAAELLLTGDPFDVQRAVDAGLVNRVVSDKDVRTAAFEIASRIAALPPASVRLTKRLLKAGLEQSLQEVIDREVRHFVTCLRSDEAQEALSAFMEKRPPDFSRF